MTCDEARFGFYALLDDELEVDTSVDVLAHLERCSSCQTACELDRQVKDVVREHLSTYPAASSDLWRRIGDALSSEADLQPREAGRTARVRWGVRRLGIAAWRSRPAWAAVAAVITLAFSLALQTPPEGPPAVVDEIVADHVASLERATGPADVASSDPRVIVAGLRDRIELSEPLRTLRRSDATLLGGSFCQLRSTQGIRLTYAAAHAQTVSFYQLVRSRQATFPGAADRPVYVRVGGGTAHPGAILWRDGRFLYALVADLPPEALQGLMPSVTDG